LFFSKIVNHAVEYAAIAHREQLRKSPEAPIPYIHHSVMVGLILQKAGFPDHVVAAGILHDVLEDTPVAVEELRADFGREVADLVDEVSEQDKSLPWEQRKERYLDHIKTGTTEAKAIAAADKIHNINSILLSLERGADIWNAFKRGREAQLDRFKRLLATLKAGWNHALVDELEAVIRVLESAA
jgi:(p)ppGpp synthase/HD superfamily hydrolase